MASQKILRVTNWKNFSGRFFSTVTNTPEDTRKAIDCVILPWKIFQAPYHFKEFATNNHYSAWNVLDHSNFMAFEISAAIPDWTIIRAILRRFFVIFAWEFLSYDTVIAACSGDQPPNMEKYTREIKYIEMCFVNQKPHILTMVFIKQNIGPTTKNLLLLWWVMMSWKYAGHFFILEAELSHFLRRTIRVEPSIRTIFMKLRNYDCTILRKVRGDHETGLLFDALWIEKKIDRLMWGATVFFFGIKVPEFKETSFWKTYISWMEPTIEFTNG